MRFRPEPDLERKLAPGTLEARQRAAANAARLANSFAGHPLMPRQGQRSQPVQVDTSGDQVRVVNTDYGASITEYGSALKNTPARAPLRRGVGAAGLRLEDTGKQ